MIAWWFRQKNDDGTLGTWVGLAVAHSKREMFWAIDSHIDPWRVVVAPARYASVCINFHKDDENTILSIDDPDLSHDPEAHDIPFDCKWKSPKWQRHN